MVVVGYDDAKQAFRIQNSWGRTWGDGGYGWFSYEFWKRNVTPRVRDRLSLIHRSATAFVEGRPKPPPQKEEKRTEKRTIKQAA